MNFRRVPSIYKKDPKNLKNPKNIVHRYIVYRNPQTQKSLFDEFVFKNVVVFNPDQRSQIKSGYVKIKSEVWKTHFDSNIPNGYIYLNGIQRIFYSLAYEDTIEVTPFLVINNPFDEHLKSVDIDVFSRGKRMELSNLMQLESMFKSKISNVLQHNLVGTRQPFCVKFDEYSFKIIVRRTHIDMATKQNYYEVKPETNINIYSYNGEDMSILLNESWVGEEGDISGEYYHTPLQSWDLKKEGVGGLGNVANELFRRAFASRQNPAYAKKLGTKHVKGVILHGSPGCGKTLVARTIARLLNKNIPPKIISGPEIFDKFVGESQRKVRELFTDAENDELKYGERSPLHVLIFDEFDSIGRKRSGGDDTGSSVSAQVVNQLLAKMDGPVPLNNILIIALTNRKDIIDSALLRPGRFEIQIEVKLPTVSERKEIFEIHTSTMMENGALDESISLTQLAKRADNFTGAEIEGLVKSAASYALTRTITIDDETHQITVSASSVQGSENTENTVQVTVEDFEHAFNDVKPQFGIQQHKMFTNLEDIELSQQLNNVNLTDGSVQTVLIYTDNAQKTKHEQFVGKLAFKSGISCLMCIDYFDMIGMNELQACKYMKEVYIEASNTPESIIVINHLDTILGIRYNASVLQTVITLLRYYPHVITIATVSGTQYSIESTQLDKHFDVTKKINI